VKRYALIDSKSAAGWSGNGVATVERYLPGNYEVLGETSLGIVVAGEDDCGWTLDDYVLPRLSSGLIAGQEIDLSHPALKEIVVNG
jgi:hypothetical protein